MRAFAKPSTDGEVAPKPDLAVLKNPAGLRGRAIDRAVPTDYLRRADHYDDADCTDGELRRQVVAPLRQGELAYDRKQNAETENLQRILAATNSRLGDPPPEERRINRGKFNNDDSQRQKVHKPDRRQSRLVDGPKPVEQYRGDRVPKIMNRPA